MPAHRLPANALVPLVVIALLLVGLGGAAYAVSRPPEEAGVRAEVRVAEALGGNAAGFARATEPRDFAFPADHGPHPEYRTEWWYYTGNLEGKDGRHFGFQLTFFRTALARQATERESSWGTNQVYMAHFALTDVAGRQFHAFERFSREAQGLAGAQAEPFRVWLEDWSASAEPAGGPASVTRLRAREDTVAIDLLLGGDANGKPLALQGDRGLSQKGPEPGNASYYYSATRLPARGTVTIANDTYEVTGLSWLDREWSTSALREGLVGWDWFALQLDDGREIMLYRLRRKDGSTDPFSGGVIVAADGATEALSATDFTLRETGRWQSPHSGITYPSGWQISVPKGDLELNVEPYLADQELNLTVRYWEGAVRIEGTGGQGPVTGSGYVELTGYGDSPGPRS